MKKEDEIEKLKKCLKNKEKRLKKIEERFKIRNSILWFVGWTFVCFFWVVYLVYNIENIDIELLRKIFLIIGIGFSVILTFFVYIFGLIKIGEYVSE